MRTNTKSGRKNSVKLLASAALVVAAAGVAGLGTYGSFTSTTAAETSVGTGTVKLDMGNQATRGLDVPITNMVPGDFAPRAVQLTRSATSESFGSLKMTTTMTAENLLKTGGNGLKLKIDSCATPWIQSATSKDLTCAGTPTTVLAPAPVTHAGVDLTEALADLNGATKVANLRLEVSLPEAADNTYQGLNNTVKIDFTATQRAGGAR